MARPLARIPLDHKLSAENGLTAIGYTESQCQHVGDVTVICVE